jgi:hypothetical protein
MVIIGRVLHTHGSDEVIPIHHRCILGGPFAFFYYLALGRCLHLSKR